MTHDGPARGARPRRLVLVVGTGTDVGKTWVGAALATELRRRGCTVAARKPAQSFAPGDPEAGTTDAQVLGAATGEDPGDVCPPARWYPVPMAPPMAAAALGRTPASLAELAAVAWPATPVDVGLLEGAGGVRSPLAEDGDVIDLARPLAPEVAVVVADAGLGTINAVVLTTDALAGVAPVVAVHLNRWDATDDLHRRNLQWLQARTTLRCTTEIGSLADLVTERGGTRAPGHAPGPP